jgi:hypothetical protein
MFNTPLLQHTKGIVLEAEEGMAAKRRLPEAVWDSSKCLTSDNPRFVRGDCGVCSQSVFSDDARTKEAGIYYHTECLKTRKSSASSLQQMGEQTFFSTGVLIPILTLVQISDAKRHTGCSSSFEEELARAIRESEKQAEIDKSIRGLTEQGRKYMVEDLEVQQIERALLESQKLAEEREMINKVLEESMREELERATRESLSFT